MPRMIIWFYILIGIGLWLEFIEEEREELKTFQKAAALPLIVAFWPIALGSILYNVGDKDE